MGGLRTPRQKLYAGGAWLPLLHVPFEEAFDARHAFPQLADLTARGFPQFADCPRRLFLRLPVLALRAP